MDPPSGTFAGHVIVTIRGDLKGAGVVGTVDGSELSVTLCVAVRCRVLQGVPKCCAHYRRVRTQCHTVCYRVLQCSKVFWALSMGPNSVPHCVLQGVAVCFSVLQGVSVRSKVLWAL